MLRSLLLTAPGRAFFSFLCGEQGKKIDEAVFRVAGFSLIVHAAAVMNDMSPLPTLILHTTGRKSGQERSAVMPYIAANDRIYLIGSNGGKPNDPAWVWNLRERPEARIIVNRRKKNVRARILDPTSPERKEVWETQAARSAYHVFQESTERPIPIVALEDSTGSILRP
ncbi:MAG: nitroreductase/quinone reductase family protein [Steroidobacteraceae bacterium]